MGSFCRQAVDAQRKVRCQNLVFRLFRPTLPMFQAWHILQGSRRRLCCSLQGQGRVGDSPVTAMKDAPNKVSGRVVKTSMASIGTVSPLRV